MSGRAGPALEPPIAVGEALFEPCMARDAKICNESLFILKHGSPLGQLRQVQRCKYRAEPYGSRDTEPTA